MTSNIEVRWVKNTFFSDLSPLGFRRRQRNENFYSVKLAFSIDNLIKEIGPVFIERKCLNLG